MGLTKDLKRMSAAIKAKFGGMSGNRHGKKGFNMFHYLIVVFFSFFLGYLFYHKYLRKGQKLSIGVGVI